MNGGDGKQLAGVQSLVLKPSLQAEVEHHVLHFPDAAAGRTFLDALEPLTRLNWGPESPRGPRAEWALGFTFRGLRVLGVPDALLSVFRQRSRAFVEGPVLRAADRLGDTGQSGAERWEEAFDDRHAHALLTVHGDAASLAEARERIGAWRAASGVQQRGSIYPGRVMRPDVGKGQLLHFDFRDGLAQPFVHGMKGTDPHAQGELLLGYPRDDGTLPWALPELPQEERRFFLGGSFGVLRPLLQDVEGFEAAVDRWARELGAYLDRQQDADLKALRTFIKAKLCGRWPDGPVVHPDDSPFEPPRNTIDTRIDFREDPRGQGCPYASHVRRMNPRGVSVLDRSARPLFRRGMAFGPAYVPGEVGAAHGEKPRRGLLGMFFCASLEEQCEHLLGQWGARLPPGVPDNSRARDPFMGAQDDAAATFLVGFKDKPAPLALKGFRSFVRTLGTAYAFYPSADGFARLLQQP